MRLATAFPSNSAAFRSFLASSPSLLLSLSLSFSFPLSLSRATVDGVDPPHESRAKKGTKRKKRSHRWIEKGGRRERRDRRRSGIHFEIASHPVRSPFSTDSSRIPTPSRGLFPVPSLRKSYSPSARLTLSSHSFSIFLSFSSSLPFARQRARLEY